MCGSTFEQNIIEVPVEDTTVVDEPKERGTETSDDEGSEHASGLIKIITIEPKSPESITLQSFLPYDIDFTKHTLYLKTSTATTKKYIDGILSANSIDTFTKNF
ncbi:MAG: hypothetical protein LBD11_00775 [Candidatus Peribacteria bacterium]|nr:hypothetical protein [Candidatus Peribacteria bacterium]